MSKKKWIVELNKEGRGELNGMINKGRTAFRKILKARLLLKADTGLLGPGWSDKRIVEALENNHTMVELVRKKLVEEGLEAVFTRKKRSTPPCKPIFDGEVEARLIALACGEPPEGHAKWSIRLLAAKSG